MTSEPDAPLGGVGETALGAAMMRAEESLRSDRLFDDPYAAAFVAAGPRPFADIPDSGDGVLADLEAAFSADIVVRTRFYDDFLTTACATGCRQVVLLGAGLDTRAYRLDWPIGVQLFEVDLPEVLAFKAAVLIQHGAEPRCARSTVAVDLRDDWPAPLAAAGFRHRASTAWIAEGLLAYMSDDDAKRLLRAVSALSADGSQLSFERASAADDSSLARARAVPAMGEVTSMWRGGLTADAAEWLPQHGWEVRADDRSALAAGYGRSLANGSRGGFLTAARRR